MHGTDDVPPVFHGIVVGLHARDLEGRSACQSRIRRSSAVERWISSGRPVVQVAVELGVSEQAIYNWRRQDQIERGRAH